MPGAGAVQRGAGGEGLAVLVLGGGDLPVLHTHEVHTISLALWRLPTQLLTILRGDNNL